MRIKILSNIESSLYIDDEFVGTVYTDEVFVYTVTQSGDYYIKLVEKSTGKNLSLSKIANVKEDILLQFDFAGVLLEHQECLSDTSLGVNLKTALEFKRKSGVCEIWSVRYGIKLSEIPNDFNEIEFFKFYYGNDREDWLLILTKETGSAL